MKKIVAFTAIRSEYDLMSKLYRLLNDDDDIDLRLIVSGAHLSNTYGKSVDLIEADGLNILAKITTLFDSNEKSVRIKSAAVLQQNCIDIVSGFDPDLIIYAGDREEVIVAALVGGYLEIPTIHFFGGDHVKDSHIDNPVRHAVSKLSTAHFVAHQDHALRLRKMGEKDERIFNIGSISLDKFNDEPLLDKSELANYFRLPELPQVYAIVIFHPVPMEREISGEIFKNILEELKHKGIFGFVSYPNIDPGNKKIIDVINDYQDDKSFFFYKNLPREIFVNLYSNAELIIGNSSSGIYESASIKIPAINVGQRQTGRLSNDNVIFCDVSSIDIREALNTATSSEFAIKVKSSVNVYGDGLSSERAYRLIKNINFKELLFKNEDILEL